MNLYSFGSLLGGRHRYSCVASVNSIKIELKGVQYETDGCYETKNKACVIETKKNFKYDNFNKRQLYLPYRVLYDKIGTRKDIICLFVYEVDGIINICKYTWSEPQNIDSLICTGKYRFKFNQ